MGSIHTGSYVVNLGSGRWKLTYTLGNLRASKPPKTGIVHECDVDMFNHMYTPTTDTADYERIKESIERVGLMYPIVALQTTKEEWRKMALSSDGLKFPTSSSPRYVLIPMCGNNRLNVAIEMGYGSIDTIICESKEEVNKLCGMMRKHWRLIEKGNPTISVRVTE